jgi:uncharacterized membrane-anchored protein
MNKRFWWLVLVAALGAGAARAQTDAIRSEFSAALHDAQATQTVGPAEVSLAGQATLQLPADHLFVPVPAAARLIRAMGNTPDPHLVGVIYPPRQENWLMAIQYENPGHINDDDARDWNVDQLLRSVSDGTEQGNEERRRVGFPEIQVLGWAEKPRYDSATHRLVWAVAARDKSAAPSSDQGVNYNTYVLGREGYFKLNFVTDMKDLHAQIPAADAIVSSLNYNEGRRYADFTPGTDKVATVGVAALVAGTSPKREAVLSDNGAHLVIRSIFWLGGSLAVLAVLFGAWRWWRTRPRKARASLRDDFPSTEISTVAMDQPTLPLHSYVPTVSAAAGAMAAPLVAAAAPPAPQPPAPVATVAPTSPAVPVAVTAAGATPAALAPPVAAPAAAPAAAILPGSIAPLAAAHAPTFAPGEVVPLVPPEVVFKPPPPAPEEEGTLGVEDIIPVSPTPQP